MRIEWTTIPSTHQTREDQETVRRLRVVSSLHKESLRNTFFQLVRQLAAEVLASGASPSNIVALLIETPHPAQIREDLEQLDLLYRECLGGNMGRVGLVHGPELALTVKIKRQSSSSEDALTPKYRGYNAADLNFQYSPRMAVPEASDIMAKWRERGTAYQKAHAIEIIHSGREKHASDLYMPSPVTTPPPLHIYIHGGYWQALDKRDNAFLLNGLVQNGVAVASLNYPLAPPACIGEIIETCRLAAADLYRKSGKYGYDGNQITVSGHSAGGHLTMAMAATRWADYGSDLPSDLIKAAAPISGVFDLEPLRHTGLNNALKLSKSDVQLWSPIFWDHTKSCPVLASVGADESDEFRRQSTDFVDFLRERGVSAVCHPVPATNHFTILHALSDSDSVFQKAMIRLAVDQVV